MKFYRMPEHHKTRGLCWKYALACLLNVHPKKVPDFMADHIKDSMDRTRKWLKKKFNKGMVYLPFNCFLETAADTDNPKGGPDGYSIMILDTTDDDVTHAVIAKDGRFIHDPNDVPGRQTEFNYPVGFCIVYDL